MTAHPTPTPTEPHHDVRERAARALYEHRQATNDFPPDGYTTWDDLPEEWQDEYREAADAVLAAVSAAVPMTTTPPPEGTTEPRCEHTEHATRGDGRYGRHFETADPAGAWEPCPSPPVSAAAPDERGLPGVWETWQRPGAHPSVASEYAAMEAGWTAALAARPAPVVNAADVEKAVHDWRFEHYDAPDGEEVHMGSCVLVQDLPRVLATLGLTVADTPAADDEGGQER